jgi:RNA 3'-terminal phosphate cyclase
MVEAFKIGAVDAKPLRNGLTVQHALAVRVRKDISSA